MNSDAPSGPKAVFLDRDGVLIEDAGLVTQAAQIRLLPGVPEALQRLKNAGFLLAVVTNQPVIARGLATEEEVVRLNDEIGRRITAAGGPRLDGVYYCPHHPKAALANYRLDCDCRKPRPGLLRRAAAELGIDLRASFLVGDRITDIAAGAAAGCRTALVETGQHLAPPIESAERLDPALRPDWTGADLAAAARWILEGA